MRGRGPRARTRVPLLHAVIILITATTVKCSQRIWAPVHFPVIGLRSPRRVHWLLTAQRGCLHSKGIWYAGSWVTSWNQLTEACVSVLEQPTPHLFSPTPPPSCILAPRHLFYILSYFFSTRFHPTAPKPPIFYYREYFSVLNDSHMHALFFSRNCPCPSSRKCNRSMSNQSSPEDDVLIPVI